MQKYIFTKNGIENQLIIDAIINFIKKNWKRKNHITLKKRVLEFKPFERLAEMESLGYILMDVYTYDKSHCNHILKFFVPGDTYDQQLWFDEGTAVEVDGTCIKFKLSDNTGMFLKVG